MTNEEKTVDTINKHRRRVFELMSKLSQEVMRLSTHITIS